MSILALLALRNVQKCLYLLTYFNKSSLSELDMVCVCVCVCVRARIRVCVRALVGVYDFSIFRIIESRGFYLVTLYVL